jgi:hypothetical protein
MMRPDGIVVDQCVLVSQTETAVVIFATVRKQVLDRVDVLLGLPVCVGTELQEGVQREVDNRDQKTRAECEG